MRISRCSSTASITNAPIVPGRGSWRAGGCSALRASGCR
jgi:hypothetical protein